MGDIKDLGYDVYRDFATPGVPASGAYYPAKDYIRQLVSAIDAAVYAAAAGLTNVSNLAARDTFFSDPDNQGNLVYVNNNNGSATDAANGVYEYVAGAPRFAQGYYQGLAQAVQPLVDQAQASADAATDILLANSKLVTIGAATGTGTSGTNPASSIGVGPHFKQRAVLVAAKVNFATAGTLTIKTAVPTFDSGAHVQGDTVASLTASEAGVKQFSFADINAANGGKAFAVEAGELFAFNGPVKYTASRESYFSWAGGLSSSPALTVLADASSGATFDAEFTFRLDPAQVTGDAVLDRFDRFTVVPADWLNNNGATTDGNGAIVLPTGGFAAQLITKRSSGLDRRRYSFDFQFTSANSHLMFATNPAVPTDSGQFEGSMFVIEADNKLVRFYDRWDGSGTAPTSQTGDNYPMLNPDGTAFTPTLNHTYTCVVEKINRDYRVTIVDPTGPFSFDHLVSDGGQDTYTAALGSHTRHGLLHGSPSFASLLGTAKILNYRVTVPYEVNCRFLEVGDSKTEGFTVLIGQRHGDLLANVYGTRQVAISGVGGATSIGVCNRLFYELDALRPDTVLINIGTNTGDESDFAANIAVLARISRNAGAKVVFATVANSAAKTTSIKALPNVTVMDFAAAMTATGAGSTRVAAYYAGTKPDDGSAFNDGLHENVAGHQREFAQLRRDVRV